MSEQSIKIIAFGHRRRVGKDTAVKFALDYLKSKGIKHCSRLSFFEPIKNICQEIFKWGGLEDAIYYENHPEKKEVILPPIGRSPRDIWVRFGEDLYNTCPHALCEIAFSCLKPGIYFIPDMRRAIEVDYVRKFGGKSILINNSRVPKSSDPVDSSLEGYLDWDEVMRNEGTLKEYNKQIIELIERIL